MKVPLIRSLVAEWIYQTSIVCTRPQSYNLPLLKTKTILMEHPGVKRHGKNTFIRWFDQGREMLMRYFPLEKETNQLFIKTRHTIFIYARYFIKLKY